MSVRTPAGFVWPVSSDLDSPYPPRGARVVPTANCVAVGSKGVFAGVPGYEVHMELVQESAADGFVTRADHDRSDSRESSFPGGPEVQRRIMSDAPRPASKRPETGAKQPAELDPLGEPDEDEVTTDPRLCFIDRVQGRREKQWSDVVAEAREEVFEDASEPGRLTATALGTLMLRRGGPQGWLQESCRAKHINEAGPIY